MTNDKNDMKPYQAIANEIEAYLAMFDATLNDVALPFWRRMVKGEFSKVAALLPYWLSDLVPVSEDICHQLGVAHLYGWWYYYVQDELLDGDAPATDLLGGHLALIKMIEIYYDLGLTAAPCWAEFQQLTLVSAETYAAEMGTRFKSLAELTPEKLKPWSATLIINRAAPFYFNTIAQLYLAGITSGQPLHGDLLAAIKDFTVARQISDDAGDWVEDLQQGRLNYVSAKLMQRLYDQDLAGSGEDLDVERLIGHQLTDEAFWDTIEQTAQEHCQQSLDRLVPYGPCRFTDLIRKQMTQNTTHWSDSRKQRTTLRHMFGIA